jgi:4-amino-4-deoxychorismate mutase
MQRKSSHAPAVERLVAAGNAGQREVKMDKLQALRMELDVLDDQLVDLVSRRFAICCDVAAYKRETCTPMMQMQRIAEVKRRAPANGRTKGLREEFVTALYDLIINEACQLEDSIIGADCAEKFNYYSI